MDRSRTGKVRRRLADFSPRIWLLRHIQVALSSLGRLARAPLGTLMTVAVIGIALALPTGLYVLLGNLQRLSGAWDGSGSLSLFIRQDISEARTGALARELAVRPEIAEIRLIGKAEALAEFQRVGGFGAALEALGDNPLPTVLVIRPTEATSDPVAIGHLVGELEQLPEVDFAQLDMQWIQRLRAITRIARRGVLVIASLLGLAVLLIVGNTIRLEIQNRHGEIEIEHLVGATAGFVRRPFLYTGLWYGLLGGIAAWCLVALSLLLLVAPVEQLAGLYQSAFELRGPRAMEGLGLLGASAMLGLGGAWLSVARHLRTIKPE